MRQVIDWFLTINLIVMMGYCSYLWYSGQLVIEFKEPQTAAVVETDVYRAFELTLKSEVDRVYGKPENGYEPYMLLALFPGLAATDFEGVEASIGTYRVVGGRLQHQITEPHLRHQAATAITTRGMRTLLDNVLVRTEVDLQADGTITDVMRAISD